MTFSIGQSVIWNGNVAIVRSAVLVGQVFIQIGNQKPFRAMAFDLQPNEL